VQRIKLTQYNSAIIGCNGIAGMYDPDFFTRKSHFSITHAGAYHLDERTNLIAACDLNKDNLKNFCAFWDIKNSYSDIDLMMSECNPEIVSICTPTPSHEEILRQVISYNPKAIFCEKPITHSFKSAKDIVSKCKEKNIKIFVNYFRRWNLTLQALKKNIDSKKYGKFIRGTCFYTKDILGNASHLMDLCNWLFQSPEKVELKKVFDSKLFTADFSFLYKNKEQIDFISIPNNNEYIFIECHLFFSNGVINIKQRGQKYSIRKQDYDQIYRGFKILSDPEDIETDWKNAPLRALDEIIHSIESDSYSDQKLDDAVNVLSQIEGIITSEIIRN